MYKLNNGNNNSSSSNSNNNEKIISKQCAEIFCESNPWSKVFKWRQEIMIFDLSQHYGTTAHEKNDVYFIN